MTQGSAPRWSSWPCVMTIASMSSARSRRYVKSGRTRSMPIISAVGKRSPQSTTTIRPSYSTTVRFLPISPTPPSGRTRRAPLTGDQCPSGAERGRRSLKASLRGCSRRRDLLEQSVPRERGPHRRELVLVAVGDGQPGAADLVAEHRERGLGRRRTVGDEQDLVDLAQRGVDLGPALGLVEQPAHLVADHVRGDADPTGATQLEVAGEDVVVAGEDREAVDRLQLVG